MRLVILPKAKKQLKKLTVVDKIAVVKKIRSMAQGKVGGEQKLSGCKDGYRVRVGDLRIVYLKRKTKVFIVLIGHRKDIYRLFKRWL